MISKIPQGRGLCQSSQSVSAVYVQQQDIVRTIRSHCAWALLALAVALLAPASAWSEEHGGGGGGCGDVFGDLIHLRRDATTGQPILAQRWVELPAELQGYGWGYCPVGVYDNGETQQEIPFLPYSCDLDPDYLDLLEEVDYFGRLNGGRTKERNHRMHLDEVISNINAADRVSLDPTGRLMLGFNCNPGGIDCEWSTIDSPMESMALYVRLMKYGHLGTDPYEIDVWAKGDPKLPTAFHPALSEEDWDKFDAALRNLLPNDGTQPQNCWDYAAAESFTDTEPFNGVWDPAEPFMDLNGDGIFSPDAPRPEPFTDLNENGVWDDSEPFVDLNDNGVQDLFAFLCADPEPLDDYDFVSSSVYLAAAANKTGKVTVDLVQYLNRILKITLMTQHTAATLNTLPALYQDCWPNGEDPADPVEGEEPVDPSYGDCEVVAADPYETPNYELFVDVQERFMDFSGLEKYKRANEKADVIMATSPNVWELSAGEKLADWVIFVNGLSHGEDNINGFVDAASDALRAIEFIHNYAIPEDLYCAYDPTTCP